MAGAQILVVGSINEDLVVAADRLPHPGETVRGGRFERHHGGKGANQAVAAARAGASVAMVGAVGDDELGRAAVDALAAEGIDVSRVVSRPAPTGIALIAVGADGQNQIVVAPGANTLLEPGDCDDDALVGVRVVVTGLEIPMATAASVLRAAQAGGATAILNPAPAARIPADLLESDLLLVVNEQELAVITSMPEVEPGLRALAADRIGPVIVTLGADGATVAHGGRSRHFAAFQAPDAVDTTGAGDAFIGALAAWLAEGSSLDLAILAANAAGSLAVRRNGAREGMPARAQIVELLATRHGLEGRDRR